MEKKKDTKIMLGSNLKLNQKFNADSNLFENTPIQ